MLVLNESIPNRKNVKQQSDRSLHYMYELLTIIINIELGMYMFYLE